MEKNRDEDNKDAILNHIWRSPAERYRLVTVASAAEREEVVARTRRRFMPLMFSVLVLMLLTLMRIEEERLVLPQTSMHLGGCYPTPSDRRPRPCELSRTQDRLRSLSDRAELLP